MNKEYEIMVREFEYQRGRLDALNHPSRATGKTSRSCMKAIISASENNNVTFYICLNPMQKEWISRKIIDIAKVINFNAHYSEIDSTIKFINGAKVILSTPDKLNSNHYFSGGEPVISDCEE